MKSGIYQIENLVSGKVYIGSAVDIDNRKSKHFHDLRNNKHVNTHLQNSFNKYGESCFDFSILHECDIDMLIVFEQYFIDDYSVNRLYNICLIAGSNQGLKHSEETRKKISISKTGHTYSLGRKYSEETKQKISLSMMGKTNHLGRKHSEETKQKMSLTKMGNTNARKHKTDG